MRYETGAAFRQALETRLKTVNKGENVPLIRLRKMVAFERLLARLIYHRPEGWVLKGGYALQLRLGDQARTTKDVDVLYRETGGETHTALVEAGRLDLGDWFAYEISRPQSLSPDAGGGLRCSVHALLDGRTFENFGIDIGIGDPIVGPVDYLEAPGYLAFAGIEPLKIPSYPVSQQIAEKLHAYTKPRKDRPNTRVKDLVDLFLLAELGKFNGKRLRKAIQATFENAETHAVPAVLPSPPSGWGPEFRRLAADAGLVVTTIDVIFEEIQRFMDPLLSGEVIEERWDPGQWSWK